MKPIDNVNTKCLYCSSTIKKPEKFGCTLQTKDYYGSFKSDCDEPCTTSDMAKCALVFYKRK